MMTSDGDFPPLLGGKTPKGFLEEYLSGFSNSYSKVGNDPALQVGNEYGRVRGGPLYSETTIAGSPSFEINKGSDALGKRSGEQLLRLQQGSGNMQNEQLQRELERRMLLPRGVSLPPI